MSQSKILKSIQHAVAEQPSDLAMYVRIAISLSALMADGGLQPSERLPSQRQLAESLGVNLTTVTKAFKYLKARGLVSSEAGRGTAVRGRGLDHIAPTYERLVALPRIDLSVLKHDIAGANIVANALRELDGLRDRESMLSEYQSATGPIESREAAQQWMEEMSIPSELDLIAMTAGAQHALLVSLAAFMKPGDIILVPSLVYQGVKAAAQTLGLGLLSVDIDQDGMCPAALAKSAANPRVKCVFLCPTLDNPTSITLPTERRHAIVELASRHGLIIIEDEVYRPLASKPLPSLRELYPHGTFLIGSMAKAIAPGLRWGFVNFPREYRAQVLHAIRGSMWMSDPIISCLGAHLIRHGLHNSIIRQKREEMIDRHRVATTLVGPWLRVGEEEGNCMWLDLPAILSAEVFSDYLRNAGIGVAPSTIFSTGPSRHNGIRIYKSSVTTDDWHEALTVIRDGLVQPAHHFANEQLDARI